jgi:hypothetical protein
MGAIRMAPESAWSPGGKMARKREWLLQQNHEVLLGIDENFNTVFQKHAARGNPFSIPMNEVDFAIMEQRKVKYTMHQHLSEDMTAPSPGDIFVTGRSGHSGAFVVTKNYNYEIGGFGDNPLPSIPKGVASAFRDAKQNQIDLAISEGRVSEPKHGLSFWHDTIMETNLGLAKTKKWHFGVENVNNQPTGTEMLQAFDEPPTAAEIAVRRRETRSGLGSGYEEDVAQQVTITRPPKSKAPFGTPEPALANSRAVFDIDGVVKKGYINDIVHTTISRKYVKGQNDITAEVGQVGGFKPAMNYNLVSDEFMVIPHSKFVGGKRTSVIGSNAQSWMGGAIDGGSNIALVARRVDTQELTGALGMDMPQPGRVAHVNLFGTTYNKIGVGDALFDAAEGIAKHKGATGINLTPSNFARDDWYVAKRGFPRTGSFTLPSSKFHDTFAYGHPTSPPVEKYRVIANVPGIKGTARSATLIGTEGREAVILSFEEDVAPMGEISAIGTPAASERFIKPGMNKHGGGGRTRPKPRDMTKPTPLQRASTSQSFMAKDVRGDFMKSPQVIDNRILASGGQMNQLGQVTPPSVMGHGIIIPGRTAMGGYEVPGNVAPFNVIAAMGGGEGGAGDVVVRGGGNAARTKARSIALPGQSKAGAARKQAAAETRKRVFAKADMSILQRGSATSAKASLKSYAIPDYDGSVYTGEETVIGAMQGTKTRGSGQYGAIGMLGVRSDANAKAITTPSSGINAIAKSASKTAVSVKSEAGALALSSSMNKALAASAANSLALSNPKSRSKALAKVESGGLAKSTGRTGGLSVPRTGGTSIVKPTPATTGLTTPTPGTRTLTTPIAPTLPAVRGTPTPRPVSRPTPRPEPRPQPQPKPVPTGGGTVPPIGGGAPFGIPFPSTPNAGGGEGTNYRGLSGFREHSPTWTPGEMAASLFTGHLGKPAPVKGARMQKVYGQNPGYFKTHSGTVKVIPLKGQKKGKGRK